MIRIKVRYKRERQGGPPDRSAEAHSIDDFAKVKTFYAKVYYRGEADYDAAYKIRVMMNTQWIADLNKTAYSRGDDPEIFVGGPIANPTVLNYNAAFGVNFVKENGSITLKVKGKTYYTYNLVYYNLPPGDYKLNLRFLWKVRRGLRWYVAHESDPLMIKFKIIKTPIVPTPVEEEKGLYTDLVYLMIFGLVGVGIISALFGD